MDLDHIKGGLYGLAIGDALGGTTEFMTPASIARTYGWLDEIIGGGVWQLAAGETTDDTAMAIAVARGILRNPDQPVNAIGEHFLSWAKTGPKDIGDIIRRVITAYHGDWYAAAKQVHFDTGGRSAGNGSLMRCLPVALAYADYGRVKEVTAAQSKMTHYDDLASEACVLYNHIAHRVLNGEPLSDALWDIVGPSRYREALENPPDVEPSGYVVHTFLWVVHILGSHSNFADVVQTAANQGGDADTVAAIAGGLAGLACGFKELPTRYTEKILVGPQLDILSEQLHNLRSQSDTVND